MTQTREAPTKAPKNDDRCRPFPCRDYHETWAHQEGEDPCTCPCHLPKGKR
jgi:hypothetical protein